MLSRRTIIAMLTAMILASIVAGPAAARPVKPQPTPTPTEEPPLAEAQQTASDRKVAAALAYVAKQDRSGSDFATLACATPTGSTTQATTTDGATTEGCYVPQAYLAVYARDQTKSYYCGPAVGQVIANYSWAVSSSANKYSQTKLAEWMRTDINGYTNADELIYGLEKGTAGSPRRPANWAWVITHLRDLNSNGTTGDELQALVRSNVSNSKMPLAVPVKPHSPYSDYNLSSWPNPVNSPGHWIAVYGWYSAWTGTDFARVYFTDSSKDEGGSTGKYWNSTRSMAALIGEHTQRLVW
jgi:hypothetical protein